MPLLLEFSSVKLLLEFSSVKLCALLLLENVQWRRKADKIKILFPIAKHLMLHSNFTGKVEKERKAPGVGEGCKDNEMDRYN